MIIDCFPFFDELDLLEIRLAELRPIVDCFVLVEATETFSGKPKPLIFAENHSRFHGSRILNMSILGYPSALQGSWAREEFTRNVLRPAVNSLDPAPSDIVMLSDLDEIPRAENVAKYAKVLARDETKVISFEHPLSYYYVNVRSNISLLGTRMIRFQDLTLMQALRTYGGMVVPDAGWHFSYLGGAERISNKIRSFSHTELDIPEFNQLDRIEHCISKGTDLFGRQIQFRTVPLDASFPQYILQNRDRFNHLIRA